MKIEIKVDDISLFTDALNNAVATYGNIIFAIYLCCDIPQEFKKLKEIPFEELQKRFDCIKDVYNQVEEIERVIKEIS